MHKQSKNRLATCKAVLNIIKVANHPINQLTSQPTYPFLTFLIFVGGITIGFCLTFAFILPAYFTAS